MSAVAILLRLLAATESLDALADPAPTPANLHPCFDGSQMIAEDQACGAEVELPPTRRSAAANGPCERSAPQGIS